MPGFLPFFSGKQDGMSKRALLPSPKLCFSPDYLTKCFPMEAKSPCAHLWCLIALEILTKGRRGAPLSASCQHPLSEGWFRIPTKPGVASWRPFLPCSPDTASHAPHFSLLHDPIKDEKRIYLVFLYCCYPSWVIEEYKLPDFGPVRLLIVTPYTSNSLGSSKWSFFLSLLTNPRMLLLCAVNFRCLSPLRSWKWFL